MHYHSRSLFSPSLWRHPWILFVMQLCKHVPASYPLGRQLMIYVNCSRTITRECSALLRTKYYSDVHRAPSQPHFRPKRMHVFVLSHYGVRGTRSRPRGLNSYRNEIYFKKNTRLIHSQHNEIQLYAFGDNTLIPSLYRGNACPCVLYCIQSNSWLDRKRRRNSTTKQAIDCLGRVSRERW